MISNMEKIFNAESIAIVGASETAGKAGERRIRSLIKGGYKGKIYPINPKRDTIFSIKAYTTLMDISDDLDLVVVVIPVPYISSVIQESIVKKVSGIIIITAGLGETGDKGKMMEREILDIAHSSGIRIIGPNCSGIFNSQNNMNLLGIPFIKKGPFSVIAQSGNVIDAISHYARLKDIGFSKVVSVGNAIDVSFTEYLEVLRNDADTRVILLYIEEIKNGEKFVEVAREVSAEKPILCLKVGFSQAAKRAVMTHTGSIAGDELIINQALKQSGIIRTFSEDEMFDMAEALIRLPKPMGKRVVVLSEGGGDNAITVDNLEKQGLEVNPLSETTQEKLKPFILEGLRPLNPIDYGGTAEENPHKIIPSCCEVCMQDSSVDMIIITGFFGGFRDIIASQIEEFEKEASRKLVELMKVYGKPILVNTAYANEKIESLQILQEAGIPVVQSSERVARCAYALAQAAETQRRIRKEICIKKEPAPLVPILTLINRVKNERPNMLETESRMVLEHYEIAIPEAHLVQNAKEAIKVAEKLGYPVVLKICSPDIIHKSDVGGVKLNLRNSAEVEIAFNEMNKEANVLTYRISGALILPQMPQGEECIIGMVRDKQLGITLMFGLGGIFTESLKDFSLRVLPLTQNDIDEMIKEIRGFPILSGVRGRKPKDLAALRNILLKVMNIAVDYPDIEEIDLNPVVVYETGAYVLDSRIIVRR